MATPTPTFQRRFLRREDVCERLNCGKSKLHELIRTGLFADGVPLFPGGRTKIWTDEDVDAYQDARLAARNK